MPLVQTDLVQIDGLKELEAALLSLPDKVVKLGLGRAVREGIAPIAEEAELLAPHRTGALQSRLPFIKVSVDFKHGGAVATMGPAYDKAIAVRSKKGKQSSQDPGVYALFVEFGTNKMAARPFMRPAFDARAEEAIQRTVDVLEIVVEEATKQVAQEEHTKK